MIISGNSMVDSLLSQYTNRSNTQVRNQIEMAVLKQIQETQEMQGQAIVEMIRSTSLDGTGKIVDRSV